MSTDRAGRSPVHYQALEGRVDELRESLEHGADPSIADAMGFTPLHFAAQSLHSDAVRVLIEHSADVNAQNRFGATPIHLALTNAREDDHGIAGLLLDAGADIDIETVAGVSARGLAFDTRNMNLKKFLRLQD